jgi:hypothetical protein
MHRIIKAHLDSFVPSHALEAEDEASQFEKFVNFSIIAAETPSSPTFPTGALILEFCRQKLNLFKGRRGGNACSEDLPSFRLLACA